MSRPPYSSTVRRVISTTASSLVTSTGRRERPANPERLDQLGRDLLGAFHIPVGNDDVRAACRERARGRPADAARAAGDERDTARELSARRRLRELVALERPVLDRERLALAQRPEPAHRIGGVLDRDRPVVEVAGEAGSPGVRLRK